MNRSEWSVFNFIIDIGHNFEAQNTSFLQFRTKRRQRHKYLRHSQTSEKQPKHLMVGNISQ